MPINLDLAISSAVRFPQTIEGFNTTLRLSHQAGLGWHVSELNLLQRLYYLLFSCFGASLAEENKSLIEKNFKLEREIDRKSGQLGNNAQTLINLFHLNVEAIKQSAPQRPTEPTTAPMENGRRLAAPIADKTLETQLFAPHAPIKGIVNPGNSCWINSCCQVLFRIESFVDALGQKSVKRKGESDDEFLKRNAVCNALKALYLEYIKKDSTSESVSYKMTTMRRALYSYSPGYFTRPNPDAQHDAAEGMAALCKAVFPDVSDTIALKGQHLLNQSLTNVFAMDSIWVKMATQLRELIDPSVIKVREISEDKPVEKAAYKAFSDARTVLTTDLIEIAEQRQSGEFEEDYNKRKAVVVAVKNFFSELKRQKGIKSENVEDEHIDLAKLKPFIEEMKNALLAINPDMSFEKTSYVDLCEQVKHAFLPFDQGVEILDRQRQLAAATLNRQPTKKEEEEYSLLYDLRINNSFERKEQPPSFICLTRQDLIETRKGVYRVRDKLTEEESAEGLIPSRIDLSELTIEGTKAVYELVGTAHHLGASNSGGHYIAKINHKGQSVTANDKYISESNDPFFCRHGAVVYKRIS